MKRREFLWNSTALAGLLAPLVSRAQARPCPPSQVSVQGGTSVNALCSPRDAEADWKARSTGAGVVWAHDFRYSDAEVTAHLNGIGDPTNNAVDPRRVADPTSATGYAMEFVALGARLAQNFPASGGAGPRTMIIDDATSWPSGGFYFQLSKIQVEQQNNLFYCNSRSGTSLNVTWVKTSGQPFTNGTQRDWLVGDVAGQHVGKTWARVFSALTGDSNGIGTDDINRAGNRLRSKVSTNPNYAPSGPQAFGYGWYGRPEYQAAYANWRPSDHGNGAIDSILRSNVWDGDEFWLQFRVKIDPAFLQFHGRPPLWDSSSEDNRWGHKIWMLQSTMTVPQQITGGYGPSNRYFIPSTPEPPFGISGYSPSGGLAGRRMTQNLNGSGSTQAGSKWESTYTGQSFAPAGSAWEFPDDEWVTFALHVKPGLDWIYESNPTGAGIRNTVIEVRVARTEDPAYDGTYTTVYSVTDQATIYGSSGPTEHRWFSALPGYNAFSPTLYLNMDLGSVPPVHSYYHRWTQFIFSKQPIPAPAV